MTQQEDRYVLKMLMAVIGALVGFFVVIVILAQIVAGMKTTDEGVDKMVEKAVVDRIKPFGAVNVGSAPVAQASSGAADGKALYSNCASCHDNGVMGAPKPGNKAAWKSRIAQGEATLFEHALKGFTGKNGTMPPKGGTGLSDDEVKAVVKYMVSQSK